MPVNACCCGGGGEAGPPLPPDCCYEPLSHYCFDQANARFQGHITVLVRLYDTVANCGGSVDHVVEFGADYDLPARCGASDLFDSDEPPVGTGPGFLKNVTCKIDGANAPYDGTGAPLIALRNFKIKVVAPGQWELDGVFVVGGDFLGGIQECPCYFGSGSNVAGNALGFETQTNSECHNNGTGSFSYNSTIDMTVANNYCCCSGDYECVARSIQTTNGDGTC